MRLEDPDTVDYMGVEKGTQCIVLTLADDFNGDDELKRLKLLQTKIYRYLDFIDTGEVYEATAKAVGRPVPKTSPVRVQILARMALGEAGQQFLRQVQDLASKEGVALTFKVLGG